MKKITVITALLLSIYSLQKTMAQDYNAFNRQAATPAFFIPQSELAPRYEKLPPIMLRGAPQQPEYEPNYPGMPVPQETRTPSRYVAVDGRYIPVYDTPDEPDMPLPETIENNVEFSEYDTFNNTPQPYENIETYPEFIPEPQITEYIPSEEFIPQNINDEEDDEPAPLLNLSDTSEPENTFYPPTSLPVNNQPVNVNSDTPQYLTGYEKYMADLQQFSQTGTLPANTDLDELLNNFRTKQEFILYQGPLNLN